MPRAAPPSSPGSTAPLTRWAVGSDPTELAPRTVALVDHRGGAAVTVVDQVGLVRTFAADGSPRRRLDRWAVGEATGVDIGADGAIVLATSTGAVRLLDPAGAAAAVLDRPQGDVSDVSLAPDDGLVATGVSVQKAAEAWDDTIEVTELAGGTPDFTLGGEAENVTGCSFYEANVVFSPDGSLLASSSARLHGPDLAARRPGRDDRARAPRRVGARHRVLARRHDAAHVGRRRHAADVGRRRLAPARRGHGRQPRRLVLAGVRP